MIKYYAQEYTCENGAIAKILIPEDATKDDVLGIREFIDVILKRKYKIEPKEILQK